MTLAPTPRRPTVALVAHAIHDEGGMERAMAELIRRECESFDFVVVALHLDASLRPLVACWVRVPGPTRPGPLEFASFFLVAGARLRGLDVDLVHTLGAIVANRCDLASVHSCHAGSLEKTGALAPRQLPLLRRANTTLMHAMALVAERWTYRPGRARRIAAVSGAVAREVEHHYPGVPVAVTPNGVDVERFRPAPEAGAALRRLHGAPPGDVVVLFVGGIWEHKGLHIAARGMALAQERSRARLHLWVLGEGDPAGARASTSFPRMLFLGKRPDTERHYSAADLFVLPSRYEAAPLVSYEAAASGVPIIATRVGGVDELVGQDAAGILVERSAEAVGTAVAALADDPERRASMGAEGRRRAAAHTWERSAASVAALYRDLLGAPASSG